MNLKNLIPLMLFISCCMFSETKLLVLGSGTPNPDPDRSGSAYAVVVNGKSYLVDFGPGVVRRASSFSPSWGGDFESMEIKNLEYAFLTHLHSDHSAGLADLILTPWVLERENSLKLFGPKGLENMATKITEAYLEDIDYRINGSQPSNLDGYRTEVKEISEGLIFQDKNIKVEAFLNNHGDFKNSFGFIFTTADKKIVFSGDTAYSEKLISIAKNADILVHEVYSEQGFKEKSVDWQKYHKEHHTSSVDVGRIAQSTQPKKLVLSHILFWGKSEKSIIEEVKEHFKGNVLVAEDLMVID